MARDNDTTTRFNVDITELRTQFREAQRQVRLANSEFQSATSGMNNWADSADGLSAKINQLNNVLVSEERKLDILRREYELTANAMGSNSREAQELLIRLNNQQATVGRLRRDITNYQASLDEMTSSTNDSRTALERLTDTVSGQEKQLKGLKDDLANAVLVYGENSAEAQALKSQIERLNNELNANRDQLNNARQSAENYADSLNNSGDSANDNRSALERLSDTVSGQEKQLKGLKDDLANAVLVYGENSAEAQALRSEIERLNTEYNNNRNQLNNARQSVEDYADSLNNSGDSANDNRTALERLTDTVSDQETRLADLREAYANAVIEQGESSAEAQRLAGEISQLSQELSDNRETLENARNSADEFDNSLEDVEESAEDTGDGFTVLKGAISDLVSDALSYAIDKFKELMTSADQALNTLQVKTGLSSDEMSKFKDEMNDLYKNNYGESLEDIADSFAKVTQNSKETDPSKIKDLVKNAIVLRDSFGYEIPESMRAVNMLIDQFGMTGEEAFNLIAQGSQNGLDKNEDLLDTINEYGVHYHNLGYSAEEFFNSLKNGTDAGTFSVDKLGDAMKEFGIIAKEGSDETVNAWATLGLVQGDNSERIQATTDEISKQKEKIADLEKKLKYAYIEQGNFNEKTDELKKMKMADNIADWESELSDLKNGLSLNEKGLKEMQNAGGDTKYTISELMSAFNEGGDKAKEATQDVMNALFELDDETERNALGVQLFGTMWEDLQADGVKALSKIDGEFDKTAETMKEIDSIKYDDIGSALGVLGRTIETEIIRPFVDKVVPPIKDFIGWLIENIPIVESTLAGIGTAMATMFVAKQIMAVVNSWKAYKTATEGASIAQWLLNSAQLASPMTLIIGLIAGLVAAFVVLWNKSEAFRNFWIELWENIKSITSDVVTAVGEFFSNLWENIKSVYSTVAEWFSEKFTAVKDAIITVITPILDFFSEVWAKIKEFFTPAVEWFKELFSSVWQTIKDIWDNITGFLEGCWELIKVVFTPVAEWFKEKFSSAWNGIKDIFSAVKGWFTDRWDEIKAVFSPVADYFSEKFTGGWNKTKEAFSKAGSFFSDLWEEIKKPFSTVATWFRDTFSEAWQNVKDVFSTGGRIFEGIKEGISGVFTTVVNGIIRGINNVIEVPFDAINSALRKIRDVSIAGVEPFADKIHEIDVPHIPELARGGVLRKGKWGFLEGDGDEAVVPLEKNTRWIDEVASRIIGAMPGGIPGTPGNVSSITNYNFYQTNNSPKALSRLEIYRQSKNLLNAKGV